MKKAILAGVLGLVFTTATAQAQMGQMMRGDSRQQSPPEQAQQGGQQYGPGMMGYGMMGRGMMDHGMGPGMMGRGMMRHGMGYGMMGRGMMGYGMGPGMMGSGMVDPAVIQKQNTFLAKTATLRKKILDKQFEYFEAVRDPKTTQESLMKKQQELYDLRQELNDKAQAFWKQ